LSAVSCDTDDPIGSLCDRIKLKILIPSAANTTPAKHLTEKCAQETISNIA